MFEVGNDVFYVFKSDGDSHQTVGNTCGGSFFGSVRRMRHRRGVFYQRFRVAEADRDGRHLQTVAEFDTLFHTALYFKGNNAAETVVHLFCGNLVTFVVG